MNKRKRERSPIMMIGMMIGTNLNYKFRYKFKL